MFLWFSRPGIACQLLSDSNRQKQVEELFSESFMRERQRYRGECQNKSAKVPQFQQEHETEHLH